MRDPRRHNPIVDGSWDLSQSTRLYGLEGWSKGYFGVNAAGHLAAHPLASAETSIDLYQVVQGLAERGIDTPILLRFSDMMHHRMRSLRDAFDEAIADNEYQGSYSCVYPIKVNQARLLCQEFRDMGAPLGFGFEAGSKAELLAVLGLTVDQPQMPIICNGFKDSEFIETVVLATKLGRRIVTVIERYEDVELLVQEAQRYGSRPAVGLRIKPTTRSTGRWATSAGVNSKFGLTATETLSAVEHLRRHDLLSSLKMVHFHVGSQISDIGSLKSAVTEAARYYAQLRQLGAEVDIIDVGGGLGVDYDGSSSTFESSMNYTMQEYAGDVVYRIKTVCDEEGVPHPAIFSESGRAIVAYSSALVFEVVGSFAHDLGRRIERPPAGDDATEEESTPQPLVDLNDALASITDRSLLTTLHDALQARDEAFHLFTLGYLSLPMRAEAERLFWEIGHEILGRARRLGELPEELRQLDDATSDIYYSNFSVFQSLPDAWAIGQLFPIVPLHRLNERPTRRAALADITCDSDGKVDQFIDPRLSKRTLEVHALRSGEPYFLGAFLVGAYQEVLGDLHNLFGDTHVVHISVGAAGEWRIDEIIAGDTVRETLGYLGYDGAELMRQMRRDVEAATRAERLTVSEGRALLDFYQSGLSGYTYLK